MDRRSFLNALVGLGAAVVLPIKPTEQQIVQAWDHLQRHPFLFEVGEFGTIIEPDTSDPQIRSDIYDCISTAWIDTPSKLVSVVKAHPELLNHFVALASSELEDAQRQLERDDLSVESRAAAQRTIALISNPDYDWPRWVSSSSREEFRTLLRHVDEWLDDPLDWSATEWWPRHWSGQGKAMQFFESMDRETLDALAVVIVEGDCPSSSYFAAELRQSIEEANAIVEKLGLPFRFVTG